MLLKSRKPVLPGNHRIKYLSQVILQVSKIHALQRLVQTMFQKMKVKVLKCKAYTALQRYVRYPTLVQVIRVF